MDIFLSKLMHVLAFAGVALIAVAFCGVVLIIMGSFRGHMPQTTWGRWGMVLVFLISGPVGLLIMRSLRGPMPERTGQRVVMIFVFVVALPVLLFTLATLLLLHFSVWHRFNVIMAQKPNRLVISSEGKTNEISDPVVIDEFFRVVTHSKKVMAHHSHTVSEVALSFPQTGYIYSLCRDSQYPNEFWFGWNGIAGRERDWLDVGASLGRLRSEELAGWLQKYSPPGAPPSPDLNKQN